MVAVLMKRTYWACVTLWALLTLYLLGVCIVDGHLFTDSEIYTIYFLKVSALNFPSGPLVLSLGEVCILSFDVFSNLMNNFSITQKAIISWLIMSIFGFIQWFILLPIIYRKLRRHRQAKPTTLTKS